MENDLCEINKTEVSTRLGQGKKRKTSIDKNKIFVNGSISNLRAKERYQSWISYHSMLEENLISHHEKMCKLVFEDIMSHLTTTNEMLDIERMMGSAVVQLLPVLCLNTGINLPDHETTFSLLTSRIQSDFTEKVCRLSSINCSSLKNSFTTICKELSVPFTGEATLSNLENHFQDDLDTPIMLIFEDCESIDSNIFSKILEIIAAAQSKIKFMVLLGIATDPALMKDILPYETLSLLDIKHFSCLRAVEYLQEFMNVQLMSSDAHFQLNGRCFEFVLLQFLYNDFSVSNFANGLNFAALEHFRNFPLSFLCADEETMIIRAKTLTQKELNLINKLPSMSKTPVKTKDDVIKLLKKHFELEKCCIPLLQCLQAAQKHLIEKSFGRIRENYLRSLGNCLVETKEYRKFITYLTLIDLDKFENILTDIKEYASGTHMSELNDLLSETALVLMEDDLNEIIEENIEPEPESKKTSKSAKNAYELQRQLRSEALKTSKPKTKYQFVRKTFTEKFDAICKKYFPTARDGAPLSEIFFFGDSRKLKNRMEGCLVKNLKRALCDPYIYTKDEAMKIESADSISSELPDICISYKLFAQQGNMINLADWMDSFKSIKEEGKKKSKPMEHEARFLQSANDLQFMGLLKVTQRKTDHVQKCTWAL